MTDVDVVVIGAGNAGLTAAATLQRAGIRTLLVERHNVPGGCATSFRRGRYEFEVALHQLSGVGLEGQGSPCGGSPTSRASPTGSTSSRRRTSTGPSSPAATT
ncbi:MULTISPECIES: FAD-dependent oxidoreductase [Streptomyces]|uniref:FAD-dependent oxidoreductase n=1 Tax=Streptomyces TaxID=1883 RepID=UPI00068BC3C4|nr:MULTISPECIES: FAD-dependent oxidoreductase [Streptomyces]